MVAVQDCTIYATVVSHGFDLFVAGGSHFFFIERALAIVQQCNDHTDKRSLERPYCWTQLSITSGEYVRCSKRIAQASELGSCQSNVCDS